MEIFKLLGTIAISGTDKANQDIDKTKQHGEKLATQFSKAADEVAQFGIKVATTVTSAATAIGTFAIKSAADFETSFAKVSTLLDTTTLDVDAYKKKIAQVSSDMNVSTDELCESIYQAISASVDQADAIDFTTQAMKLAKGGFTDTATAVDIMTTAINAYGMSASDAESISDKLIMTQNKGKTTVGELAAAMGRVIPAANTFGVSLDELCGYYATMTANGIATAETTTYLNSMIKELGTGSDVLYSQIENATESILGEKKSFQELRAEGYSVLDIIGVLGQYSEQTGDSIIGMFSSSEGGMAAQVLANNIEGVTRNIDAMKNSAGATEEAYEKMASTATASFKKIKNQVNNMFTELGKKLMPTVEKLLNNAEKSLPKIQNQVDKLQPAIEKGLKKLEPVLDWLIDDALPGAVKLLGFCIDNFESLSIAVGLTVAALKTMSVITTITTAIKTSTTAMGAFNAVMAANPIGLVVTALGALAVAIGAVTLKSKAETQQEDERLVKFREEREARQANIDKINDELDAIDKKAQANLNEVANTERLWKELQTLCDEEGNVSDANKERAEFILNQLNGALGTEYTMTGNQIDNYNELTDSVYKAIEAKKAEILLSAQEEKYKESLQALNEAEKDAYNLKMQLSEQRIACDQAEEEWDKVRVQGRIYGYEQQYDAAKENYEKEKVLLDEKQAAYDNSESTLKGYYNNISMYESASALILQGKTEEAINLLDRKNQALRTAADVANETAEEQRNTLEQQKRDADSYYKFIQELYDSASENQKKVLESRLSEAREYAEKSNEEYKKLGSTSITNFESGANSKSLGLNNTMRSIAFNAKESANIDTSSVGANIVDGISIGVESRKGSLFSKMGELASQALARAREALDIHSPSRKFADLVGAYIPSGIGMGVEENENEAIDPIENMVNKMASTASVGVNIPLGARLSDNINLTAMNKARSLNLNGNNSNADLSVIVEMLKLLVEVVQKNGNAKVYLDGDVLVGEIAPSIDSALGKIADKKGRGV